MSILMRDAGFEESDSTSLTETETVKMHRLQSDSGSSDDNDSMDNPPAMRSTVSSSKCRLEDPPEILTDVNSLRDDFNKLYEKDYPQLRQCIEKLHNIIRTFEEDFRRATKGTRDGGAVMGMAGGVGLVAGIAGLALAPFTGGASLVVAGAAAAGGGVYGGMSSSEKKRKMTQLRQDIEAEVKEFQNIINPMSEKMKDINERIEEILKDLDKLEKDASGVSEYFASTSKTSNIRREDMTALTAQMSITMSLIGTLAAIFSGVWLLLDLLSVIENTRALDDMDYLAKRDMSELIDESKMKTEAGKFIVGMRKAVIQLQNIMEEIKKTKDAMEHFYNTT
ncbi:unnamed protein product [Leuciscus chuanchicus]